MNSGDRRRSIGFLLIAAASLVLTGCNASQKRDIAIGGPEIPVDTPIAVDVTNWNGEIRLRVDKKLQNPVVRAKVAESNRQSTGETESLRDSVQITAETELESGRAVLRVTATGPEDRTGAIVSDITIWVPACNGVRIRNSGGAVFLEGVSGAVQVENGFGGHAGGPIQLLTDQPMVEPVALTTSDGRIHYQVGPQSTGRFELESGTDPVQFWCKIGTVTESEPSVRRWVATLNAGTNHVYLRSEDGPVQAFVIENAGEYRPPRP
jgi:predicted small secreted protein